jgi:hypothetical protein
MAGMDQLGKIWDGYEWVDKPSTPLPVAQSSGRYMHPQRTSEAQREFDAAQKRLVQLQREIQIARSRVAKEECTMRKSVEVKARRQEMDAVLGRDAWNAMRKEILSLPPAEEEELRKLADHLHKVLQREHGANLAVGARARVQADGSSATASALLETRANMDPWSRESGIRPPDPRGWYKQLFRSLSGTTGRMSCEAFIAMLRDKLRMRSRSRTEESELQTHLYSVWRALDDDGAGDMKGYLNFGEFVAFMRRGPAVDAGRTSSGWREKLAAQRHQEAESIRQRDRRSNDASSVADDGEMERGHRSWQQQMEGSQRANEGQQREVSQKINHRLTGTSWFKLFKEIDQDNNGRISWQEFVHLVRDIARLSVDNVPDGLLRSVWTALDPSLSGELSLRDYATFIKRGAPVRPTPKQPLHQVEALRSREVADEDQKKARRVAAQQLAVDRSRLTEEADRLERALRRMRHGKHVERRTQLPALTDRPSHRPRKPPVDMDAILEKRMHATYRRIYERHR